MAKGGSSRRDPELERLKAEQKAAADAEKSRLDRRKLEEGRARGLGLRGVRSLLSGGFVGFRGDQKTTGSKTNLGN